VEDEEIEVMLAQFEPQVLDELDPGLNSAHSSQIVSNLTVALAYPHWRAGTLPLSGALSSLFPTAHESPRIQFTFVDKNSGEKFPGWVVRPGKYIFGLRDWYLSQGVIPGSLLYVQRSNNPGEVSLRVEKKRGSRDWIRTLVIGSNGGIVFSMLKHTISTAINERLAFMISDVE
jgi:hypothetical protein